MAVSGGLLDGKDDMMAGCGKGSAPVGEAVREVSKLCKENAGLSPSLGLHYSTPVPNSLSQDLQVSCLPVSTP